MRQVARDKEEVEIQAKKTIFFLYNEGETLTSSVCVWKGDKL